jgi:hypothetical protein
MNYSNEYRELLGWKMDHFSSDLSDLWDWIDSINKIKYHEENYAIVLDMSKKLDDIISMGDTYFWDNVVKTEMRSIDISLKKMKLHLGGVDLSWPIMDNCGKKINVIIDDAKKSLSKFINNIWYTNPEEKKIS